ncbi:uncharacterized protein LOC113212499 [Frankliniella occidentalis]|uniref:Uncharacterized protein LOC113212499 n=1 Tax=Frankliniella occidentalis TaxID=133901 RepID=A0A6J1T8K6_FRAOC|nr:uncharacterized protein LOC113212499 [Frankliniella occidentalis]XP_026287002.1 uncharacterized protein LOC113212499 [Frankliniella occidentalis]
MLPSPQQICFPKDEAVKAYIQYIGEDGLLWVNLASDLHKVETITNTLNSIPLDEMKESPAVHEIVCALHNDDTWYRACVLSTEPNFKVQFIDFGDTLDIPLCKLAQLPDTLAYIQPLAVKVKLPPSTTAEPSVGSSLLLQYIDCVEGTVMVDVIHPDSGTVDTVSCEEFGETQDFSNHQTYSTASENSILLDNASGLGSCNTYQTQNQSSQHELESTSTSVNNTVSCFKDEEHLTLSEEDNGFSYTTDQATDLLATPFFDETLTLQCGAEVTSHLPKLSNSSKNMNVEECNLDLSFEDRPKSGTVVTPQSNSFITDYPYYVELTSDEKCDSRSRSDGAVIPQSDGDAEDKAGESLPTHYSEETIFAEECTTALPCTTQPEYDEPDISPSDSDASCKAGEPSSTHNSEETIVAEECTTALPCATQPEYDEPDISPSDSDASCKAGEPSCTYNSEETIVAEECTTALPCATQPENHALDVPQSDDDAFFKAGEPSPTHDNEETINAEECTTALPCATQPEYNALDIPQSDVCYISQSTDDASCKAGESSSIFNIEETIVAEECTTALPCATQPEYDEPDISPSDSDASCKAGEPSSTYNSEETIVAEECTTALPCATQPENHALDVPQSDDDAIFKAGEPSPTHANEETINAEECTTALPCATRPEYNALDIPQSDVCDISQSNDDASCKPGEPSSIYNSEETIVAEECTTALPYTTQPEYDASDISQSNDDAPCKAGEQSPTHDNEETINPEECSAALSCGTQSEHDATASPQSNDGAPCNAGELSPKYGYEKLTNAEECTAPRTVNQPENHASVVAQPDNVSGRAGELSTSYVNLKLNSEVCTAVLSVVNEQGNNTSVIPLCEAEELSPTYEDELINAEDCSAALSWTNVLFKSEDPVIPTPSYDVRLINNDKNNLGLRSTDLLSDQSVMTNADAALVVCEALESSIPPLKYNDVVINPDKGNPAPSCVNYPESGMKCKVVEENNISPPYGQDLIGTDNGKSPNRQSKNITVSGINEHSLQKQKPCKPANLESTDVSLPSPKDAFKDRYNLPSNSSNINDSNMHRQQKPRLITKGRTTDTCSNVLTKDSMQSARIPSSVMAVPTKAVSNSFQELKSILELELSIVREQNRLEMLALQKKTEQNLANQIDTIKMEVSRQLQALFHEVNNRLQSLHDSMVHKLAEMYSDISLLKNELEAGEKNTKSSAKHSGKKHQPIDTQNTSIAKDLFWNSQHHYPVELGAQFGNNYYLSSQKHNAPSSSFQGEGKSGVNQPMVHSNDKMLETPKSDQFSAGTAICHPSLNQNNYQHHSTYPKMDHIETGQGVQDAATNKPQSRIVSVTNLNTQKINPNHLFNLFGVYGKVCLVKINTAQHKAYIEMADANQAREAICHLNSVPLMGRRLRVVPCKFDKLHLKREDFQNDMCKDFTKSPQHNKSQRTRFQKIPPSNTLQIFNILNTVSQDKLKEVFCKGGHPMKSLRMVKLNDEKSKAYAEFGSVEEAVNALTVMHLQETTDWVRMFIAFSRGN